MSVSASVFMRRLPWGTGVIESVASLYLMLRSGLQVMDIVVLAILSAILLSAGLRIQRVRKRCSSIKNKFKKNPHT
ncbi:MAG: hypothetical protein J4432_01485 [DPANN group archaeon]|nr:hypothetical protein [DPANN group archaeon]